MEDSHARLCGLQKQTWKDYKAKRTNYTELQSEITRLQEQGREVSNILCIEAVAVQLQYYV